MSPTQGAYEVGDPGKAGGYFSPSAPPRYYLNGTQKAYHERKTKNIQRGNKVNSLKPDALQNPQGHGQEVIYGLKKNFFHLVIQCCYHLQTYL